MAIKVGSTTVIYSNTSIDWAIISNKPQYIGSYIESIVGDNSTNGPAANVAYYSANATLEIWFNTNCVCVCVCDCGDGCFLKGSLITMWNGETLPIELVKIGDKVKTLTGIGTVLKTPLYKLGKGRSIVKVKSDKRELLMSDDHSLWTLFSDKQWWGTYNYSHYLWEMNNVDNNDGEGPQLIEHSRPLIRNKPYYHATDSGFVECKTDYNIDQYDPNTQLFHLIVDKGSYFVDGFIVSSSPKDEYYINANWK